MTNSVVNNSVFRGFFEKQKLTGPNFIDWYRQLRIVLSVEDRLNYLKHPIPAALVLAQFVQQVTPEALAAHAAWVKGSKEIARLMLITMDSKIQQNPENLNAYDEEGQSVSSYVLKIKSYIDNLKCLGNPVTLGLGLYEQTLSKNNAPTLHAIRAGKVQKGNKKHQKPQPQLAVRGQNQRKGKNKLAYAPKPKIPPPPKREDPAKDCISHQCGKTSHWKRNCPQNNMVYLSVVSRDGIFEIDFSDSYTNVSSMYDLSNKRAKSNLEYALLWHYHLGHISKKRIEKLQNNGLLNSIDFRAFEKCVPCMSSKMARKPYTHQVERPKDLLGLINTN
nr:hypothetical protein [Tanacetum cinerariifolium]